MTVFMKFRDDIRKFFSKHAALMERLIRGFVWFFSAMIVDSFLGFTGVPSSPLIAAGLAVFLAFIPYSAGSLIFLAFILMQLFSLSTSTGITGLIVFALGYIICGIYRSKHPEFLVLSPAAYRLNIPFAFPLFAALFGRGRDAAAVICGCITTWYLKAVTENIALITDKENSISPLQLLSQTMITNPMFYCFLGAAAAMFLVTYLIRNQEIAFGWQIGAVAGTVTEFAIMLAGDLFCDRRGDIPSLILSNVIILPVALFLCYMLRDFDFHRTERLRFEDDEYYYYVTAVPKIRLVSEKNEVKMITGEGRNRDRRQDKNAVKGAGR